MTDYVKEVEELMKIPQGYCKACGRCCQIATARGCISFEELIKIANNETDAPFSIVTGANDFLSIFKPYQSIDEARKVNSEFVDMVLKTTNKNENEVTFFYCRYLKKDKKCQIYEDRPTLCRNYPAVDCRTIFFKNCGLEEIIKKNLKRVDEIVELLENKHKNNEQ